MRPLRVIAVCMVPGLAFAAAGAARLFDRGPVQLPSDLSQAIARYDAATSSNDVGALQSIVLDDYLLVNSDMTVQRKASYLADFRAPGFRLEPFQLSDRFSIADSDSALVGGSANLHWHQGGKDYRRTVRIAHFWVKRAGKWQLAYTQLTRQP